MERLALFKKKTIQIRQQLQVTGHPPRNFSKHIGGWGWSLSCFCLSPKKAGTNFAVSRHDPPGRCWCWNEFLVSKVRWDEMDCLLFFSRPVCYFRIRIYKTIFLKNPKHPWDVISYFMLDLVWKYHIYIMYSFFLSTFQSSQGWLGLKKNMETADGSVPTWPIGLLGLKIIMIEMAIQPWIMGT